MNLLKESIVTEIMFNFFLLTFTDIKSKSWTA